MLSSWRHGHKLTIDNCFRVGRVSGFIAQPSLWAPEKNPKKTPLRSGRPLQLRTGEIKSNNLLLRADRVRVRQRNEVWKDRGGWAEEGRREKWPSRFDGAPDDESDNNGSYSQHDHQDADLLPGTPLWVGGTTQTGFSLNHLIFFSPT